MAPGAPAAESEALQQRLRQVEEELKKKSDPQHTAKLVDLAQFKERIRQIEEATAPISSASSRPIASIRRAPRLAGFSQPRSGRHPVADGPTQRGSQETQRADRQARAEVGLAQGEAKWGAIAPAYCAVTNSRSVQYG